VDTDIPILWIVAVIAIPVTVGAILTWAASRALGHNEYRCQRCGAAFRTRSYRRFPAACPACRARDWATRG
jgi:lipopolysaccharide biosynthesis regulator YciM